ncbi:MAG: hypothetical protein RMJ84_12690 [Sandaracinaceae bacterium]|nr:hypothetical protein [Sandaracinaceae bacterium]
MRKRQNSMWLRWKWWLDDRGTATVETVIMIPVFLIVWAGVYHFFTAGRNLANMNSALRTDSWQRAYDGCDSSPRPQTRLESRPGNGDGGLFGAVMNLVGSVVGLEEFSASRETSINRPRLIGGGATRFRNRLTWMCNEEPDKHEAARRLSRIVGGSLLPF